MPALRSSCPARSAFASRLVGLVVCLAAAAPLGGCSKRVEEPGESAFKPAAAPPEPPSPDKLEIVDEVVGTGKEATTGSSVKVHYTGKLLSGKPFDSSRGKEPFAFKLGEGSVIKGWDQGVVGMKVGGKRKLTIPSALGYGDTGHPPSIPPKAGLVFDVELLGVD